MIELWFGTTSSYPEDGLACASPAEIFNALFKRTKLALREEPCTKLKIRKEKVIYTKLLTQP